MDFPSISRIWSPKRSPARTAGDFGLTRQTNMPLLTEWTLRPTLPSLSLQRVIWKKKKIIKSFTLYNEWALHQALIRGGCKYSITSRIPLVTWALCNPSDFPDNGAIIPDRLANVGSAGLTNSACERKKKNKYCGTLKLIVYTHSRIRLHLQSDDWQEHTRACSRRLPLLSIPDPCNYPKMGTSCCLSG